jgi:hypothetical protein
VDDHRPTLLGGFWVLLGGGVALLAVLIYAHPVVDAAHCPNAGGAGNASAFADPAWDVRLPLLVLGWFVLTLAEQALPTAWRHRPASAAVLRAVLAVSTVVAVSCLLVVPLETVCH